MLFLMQVSIIIIIPVGLVFDHIVSVIVFGLSLVLSMTHIIVINFIIFLQKGGGRASL